MLEPVASGTVSFFERIENNPKLKRRMRMTLPIFVTALIPISTLRKLNGGCQIMKAKKEVHSERKMIRRLIWKFCPYQKPPSSRYGTCGYLLSGTVISYGSYDPHSERLFGMVGDGVLFKANREKIHRAL